MSQERDNNTTRHKVFFPLLLLLLQARVQAPFTFSIPYAYSGIRVAGDPFYAACADNDMNHLNECSGLKVCVTKDTTHEKAIRRVLPERHIVLSIYSEDGGVYGGFIRGECNLIAGDSNGLRKSYASNKSWNGTFVDASDRHDG